MKRHCFTIAAALFSVSTIAQELVSTAGGVQESENARLSYSVGEPVTETITGAATLTQGFQQAELLSTEVPEIFNDLNFALYPNPCSNELFLKTTEPGRYEIEIVDLSGRMVLNQQSEFTSLSVLNVALLNNGMYVLHIRDVQDETLQVMRFQKLK